MPISLPVAFSSRVRLQVDESICSLSWGVFAGIAFIGFLASWGIKGEDLESAEWDEEDGSDDGYHNTNRESGDEDSRRSD